MEQSKLILIVNALGAKNCRIYTEQNLCKSIKTTSQKILLDQQLNRQYLRQSKQLIKVQKYRKYFKMYSNRHRHVQSIQNPLMNGQNEQNRKKTTQLFSQLLREFKLYYLVTILMNLLLASLFCVQYIRACNGHDLNTWLIYAAVIFSAQLIYYTMVILPSYNKSKTYFFAEDLHEVIFEGEEEHYYQLSRRQKRKMRKRIENLIKAHFKNYFKVYKFIDLMLTICDLGLIILGMIYFSSNDYFKYMFSTKKPNTINQQCEFAAVWIVFWCMILLCISRKQAIQMVILALIGKFFDLKFQLYLMQQEQKYSVR